MSDGEKVARTIRKIPPGTIVRLGGMTDCFQPAERQYGATYAAIRELNRQGVGYLIVTKSALVAENQYLEIMDRRLAHIQVSVTTTDAAVSRRYEQASLPEQRIRTIEKLQEHGFDVSVRLSPFIPEFIDFARLNAIRCDKMLVEFLRVNT